LVIASWARRNRSSAIWFAAGTGPLFEVVALALLVVDSDTGMLTPSTPFMASAFCVSGADVLGLSVAATLSVAGLAGARLAVSCLNAAAPAAKSFAIIAT
jgi:hypothetical protein